MLKKDQIKLVLQAMHKHPVAGHFGERITIEKIKRKYYWNQMVTDMKNFVKSCGVCQRQGKPPARKAMNPIKIIQPFDRVSLDILGPLPLTKKGN